MATEMRARMGLSPETLVSDIVNAVRDYAGDGFDAVEDCMRKEIWAAGGADGDSALRQVHACLQSVYTRLLGSVDETFEVFGAAVQDRFLHVPAEMLIESGLDARRTLEAQAEAAGRRNGADAADGGVADAVADEAELDERLKDLRCRIAMATGVSSAAREETADLEAELARCHSVVERLRSVAAGSGKENAGVPEQLISLMKRLQPLLTRSDDLKEDIVGDAAAGRPGSDTAEAQIHAHRAHAGHISSDALQALQNLIE